MKIDTLETPLKKISIESNKKQNKVIKITTAYRIKSCVGRKE